MRRLFIPLLLVGLMLPLGAGARFYWQMRGLQPPQQSVVLGPTTLAPSSFIAQTGSANAVVGGLTTINSTAPQYSLVTTCGANCADSAKFALVGTSLRVGASDIVCASPPCGYHITVRDIDPGGSNSPFDQALVVTGNGAPSGAAPAVVSSGVSPATPPYTNVTSLTATIPSLTSGAAILVYAAGCTATCDPTNTVALSDSASNTFTQVATCPGDDNWTMTSFKGRVTAGAGASDTLTVSFSVPVNYPFIIWQQVTGLSTALTTDSAGCPGTYSSANGGTISQSVTTSTVGDFISMGYDGVSFDSAKLIGPQVVSSFFPDTGAAATYTLPYQILTVTLGDAGVGSSSSMAWMAIRPASTPSAPTVSAITMSCSSCTYTTGTPGVIGTATATLSNGFTPVGSWSLQSGGVDHASTACSASTNFSIDSTSGALSNNSSASGSPTICVVYSQPSVTSYVQAVPITGAAQFIASVTQFTANSRFQAASGNAVVGPVNVTMNPTSPGPTYSPGLSILASNSVTGQSGNACGFHLSSSGAGAQVQAGAGGCSATGGPHGNGLYDDWSIQYAQTGAGNTPFVQPQAATAATVVSTECTAPPEAVQANFLTMAFCNDFTVAIPNTIGTGLPSNTGGDCTGGAGCWRVCQGAGGGSGDSLPHIWYQPEIDKWGSSTCNSGQGTDPVYGNLALDLRYTVNDCCYYNTMTTFSTFVSGTANVPLTAADLALINDFPMASYVKVVARDTGYLACGGGCSAANGKESIADTFLTSAYVSAGKCQSGGTYYCGNLETDIIENWGDYALWGSLHVWGGGNAGSVGGFLGADGSGVYDQRQYHEFGVLTTSNGTTDIRACLYRDHILFGCTSWPAGINPNAPPWDNTGTMAQRNAILLWSGGWNGAWVLSNGPQDYYIKSISVWSCQDWQRGTTGPNPNCQGPSLVVNPDGSSTYTVTVQ